MSVIIDGSNGVTTNTGAVYNGIASGTAVASTSGTTIDFTSIPSWVKRVTVMFNGVSTSGTSLMQILLGTGGTPTYATSGYVGAVGNRSGENFYSTGFLINTSAGVAASTYSGVIAFSNVTGNTWATSFVIGANVTTAPIFGAGYNALGAALTAVRITTVNGTDTFDAGSINILYE